MAIDLMARYTPVGGERFRQTRNRPISALGVAVIFLAAGREKNRRHKNRDDDRNDHER
jgi:hypothetical protein